MRTARLFILVFAAGLVGCLLAAASAGALDETEAMLVRARKKRMPTPRDRELAREYLSEWVDEAHDDPALRRAFQRIAQGSPPAGEQLPALTRLHANYSRARREAVRRAETGGGQASPGAAQVSGGRRGRWRTGEIAALAGLGFLAVAAGVGWILLARRWRRPA